jgi:hypothetical protein
MELFLKQLTIFLIIFIFTACGGGGTSDNSQESDRVRFSSFYNYEDAEDNSSQRWKIRSGVEGDIENIYDSTAQSRVIKFRAGGSYMIGARGGEGAWQDTQNRTLSLRINSHLAETIYIAVDTKDGARTIFYRTDTPNRGLKHGFIGGIHHGLGASITDGRWRTITRDLVADLHDAEPDNELLAVNGLIHNGGEGTMIDDIILYNPIKTSYLEKEIEVEDYYQISLDNPKDHILQWSFRGFGATPHILSAEPDERGEIEDPHAFEFRVTVETDHGERVLSYTLGLEDRGLSEDHSEIHHALGDDRTIGSVWAGDDPINTMGLWQRVTRDLQEDIYDFEPENRLLRVKRFEVKNHGSIDKIQMFSGIKAY